jgi:BirA family biotin operon repressor/biotin-[acetyl-CoA-carboxylase] ligase
MSPMKTLAPALQNLVKILNDQCLHSGHDLSLALNISRNAVWKHINQLMKYGIEIEALQSMGYRLKTPLCLLSETEIVSRLRTPDLRFELLGSVASTNDFSKECQDNLPVQFRLAEHQTQGRGRFNRAWVAPFGANILLSCRFELPQDLSHCGGLSLCVGLAVVKALQEFGLEDLACKWPNDILYRQQKLAGILIELQGEAHGVTQAIIGVGCNVNMSAQQLEGIGRPAVSLQEILGGVQDRNHIAALLMDNLNAYLKRFAQQGFADFQGEWYACDALRGQALSLHLGALMVQGVSMGIDPLGQLLLRLPSGEIKAFSAGEASLSKQ